MAWLCYGEVDVPDYLILGNFMGENDTFHLSYLWSSWVR